MRAEALAGDSGTPWIWLGNHNHAKGSTAWFVVDPSERCITRGLPGSMMPVIHDNSYRIVQ